MVTVLGGSGVIGQLVLEALTGVGETPMAAARRTHPAEVAGPIVLAVPDEAVLDHATAAVGAGLDLVVPSADPDVHRELLGLDGRARTTGSRVALGVGWDPLVADLLLARAARELPAPTQAHAAYALPGARLAGRSPGERAALAHALGRPFQVLRDGAPVLERDGEARRLAWFPRPVGPRHAAGVRGGVVHTAPRHVRSLTTVRAYRAMSTAASEGRQALANVARLGVLRSPLARATTRSTSAPTTTARTRQRWACVVEVADADTVSRAWAYGHDHLGMTAVAVALALTRLPAAGPGVHVPAQLGDPAAHLDDLAARTDLRWGRADPSPVIG